jgi:excisionase family DNA binding protein
MGFVCSLFPLDNPMLTLGQAAKAAGISKPYLSKLIKQGRISARKLENGEYRIDPSELDRIPHIRKLTVASEQLATPPHNWQRERESLFATIHILQDQLQDLREQRNAWQQQAERLLLTPPRKPWFRRLFGR